MAYYGNNCDPCRNPCESKCCPFSSKKPCRLGAPYYINDWILFPKGATFPAGTQFGIGANVGNVTLQSGVTFQGPTSVTFFNSFPVGSFLPQGATFINNTSVAIIVGAQNIGPGQSAVLSATTQLVAPIIFAPGGSVVLSAPGTAQLLAFSAAAGATIRTPVATPIVSSANVTTAVATLLPAGSSLPAGFTIPACTVFPANALKPCCTSCPPPCPSPCPPQPCPPWTPPCNQPCDCKRDKHDKNCKRDKRDKKHRCNCGRDDCSKNWGWDD